MRCCRPTCRVSVREAQIPGPLSCQRTIDLAAFPSRMLTRARAATKRRTGDRRAGQLEVVLGRGAHVRAGGKAAWRSPPATNSPPPEPWSSAPPPATSSLPPRWRSRWCSPPTRTCAPPPSRSAAPTTTRCCGGARRAGDRGAAGQLAAVLGPLHERDRPGPRSPGCRAFGRPTAATPRSRVPPGFGARTRPLAQRYIPRVAMYRSYVQHGPLEP